MKAKLLNILPKLTSETDIALVKILIEKEDVSIVDIPLHIRETYKELACISPRQVRLILLKMDKLEEVEAMVQADKEMQIWWEYSLEIERDNEHIVNAGKALGLSDEEVDTLFLEASKL